MIKTVGVDHVGVGTDMDGITQNLLAWSDYAGALLAQGYSREDVAKVIGGNFLRVYRASAAA